MNEVINYLWNASLYITFIGLVFISIRLVMNKTNCQQTSVYQLWFIFPLGLILLLLTNFTSFKVTEISQLSVLVMPSIHVSVQNQSTSIPFSMMALIVWIITVTVLLYKLFQKYFSFKNSLNTDVKVLEEKIHESAFVNSPLAFGVFKPRVYLPKNNLQLLDRNQHSMLVEHELTHCKRYDPLIRMLYKILETVFWFHPLIYIINRMLKHDQETSVDQLVLSNLKNKTQKIEYSKLLFQFSQHTNIKTTDQIPELYCSSISMLKERIMLIKKNKSSHNNFKNKLISVLLITSAITATIVTTSSLANNSDNNSKKPMVIPKPPKVSHDNVKPPKSPNPVKAPKAHKSNETGTDIKIIPIKTVAPHYPQKAAMNKVEGFVDFSLDIDTKGNVLDVRVTESMPEGVFDKEAIKSVKQFKFAPISQPVTITQKIEFKLEEDPAKVGYGVTR